MTDYSTHREPVLYANSTVARTPAADGVRHMGRHYGGGAVMAGQSLYTVYFAHRTMRGSFSSVIVSASDGPNAITRAYHRLALLRSLTHDEARQQWAFVMAGVL